MYYKYIIYNNVYYVYDNVYFLHLLFSLLLCVLSVIAIVAVVAVAKLPSSASLPSLPREADESISAEWVEILRYTTDWFLLQAAGKAQDVNSSRKVA